MRQNKFILHLVPDDKFVDMAFWQFSEVAPGLSRFVVMGKKQPLRFIRDAPVIQASVRQARQLVSGNEYAAVILHSLDSGLAVLDSVSPDKQVIWIGWGYDYYDRLCGRAFPDGLVLPRTHSFFLGMDGASQLKRLRRVAFSIRKMLGRPFAVRRERRILRVLRRVDGFSPVLESEYILARQLNPWFVPEYLPWNYGTAEAELAPSPDALLGGSPDILVGNSATPTNNHIEIFDALLASGDLTGRKIVVPLSYGVPRYRDAIIRVGSNLFGRRFIPLVNFMPLNQYKATVSSCGYVVMNHVRQQAVGNICMMLLAGAKVVLNASSPVYRWFIDRGALVYAMPAYGPNIALRGLDFQPLSSEQKEINRRIVREHWSRQAQHERTLKLVEWALKTTERTARTSPT